MNALERGCLLLRLDYDDFDGDVELVNDLGVGLVASSSDAFVGLDVSLIDIHRDLVVCNRLLGILVAILIVYMIFGCMQFFIKLVTRNITDYF